MDDPILKEHFNCGQEPPPETYCCMYHLDKLGKKLAIQIYDERYENSKKEIESYIRIGMDKKK